MQAVEDELSALIKNLQKNTMQLNQAKTHLQQTEFIGESQIALLNQTLLHVQHASTALNNYIPQLLHQVSSLTNVAASSEDDAASSSSSNHVSLPVIANNPQSLKAHYHGGITMSNILQHVQSLNQHQNHHHKQQQQQQQHNHRHYSAASGSRGSSSSSSTRTTPNTGINHHHPSQQQEVTPTAHQNLIVYPTLQCIYTTSADCTIKVWSPDSLECLKTFYASSSVARCFLFLCFYSVL